MEETGLYYLRVDNLGANGSVVGEMKWLTQQTFDALERYRVFTNDVLISIAGTIGRIAVFNEEVTKGPIILTENCAKLHIVDGILPQYLMLLLLSRPLQKQMARDYIQTTIPKLGLDRIRQLRIPPIPEISRQERVISEWEASLQKFNQTKENAHDLLASIDNYLLTELGITLPPEQENTIANRIFTTHRREWAGGRFDPHYNNRSNIALQKTLEAVHAVPLRTLVRLVTKGETPLWRGDDYQQEGIPFLRAQNISPDGIIGDTLRIEQAVDHRMKRSQLFGGEILYTMAGTIGIACIYLPENGRANINQAIAKIVLNLEDEIFKSYLVEILNSSICRRQAERALTVSAQPNINFEQIKSLLIPMSSDRAALAMIVEKCREIRLEAKLLRQQAETELETAKRRIEAMLLGGVEA